YVLCSYDEYTFTLFTLHAPCKHTWLSLPLFMCVCVCVSVCVCVCVCVCLCVCVCATKLTKESGEVQVSSLIYAMVHEAENIFKSFNFADGADEKKFDVVLKKYD